MGILDKLLEKKLDALLEKKLAESGELSDPDVPLGISDILKIAGQGEVRPPREIDPSWKLSLCPGRAGPIVMELLHAESIDWFSGFPEGVDALRQKLRDETFPDAYFERLNERFKFYAMARWGQETTPDDLKCAFRKVAVEAVGGK